MSDIIKVLGQIEAAATTPTTLYTVPSLTSTTTSSLMVCNRAASPTSFRVNIRVGGEATANKQYIYYDHALAADETFTSIIGMTLAEGDIVEVYATDTGLSFNLFGVETK